MTYAIQPAVPAANENIPGIARQLVLNVRDFGALGDGVTDDSAAFAAAFAAGNNIFVPPGTYVADILINDVNTRNRSICLRGSQGSLFAGQERTVIRATGEVAQVIRVGDTDTATPGGSRPMQVLIQDLEIDGNGAAHAGLRITAGTNITIERVSAYHCTQNGFFVDGVLACDPVASADLNCVALKSCVSHSCGSGGTHAGFAVVAPGAVIGSFDQVRLVDCQSSFDYAGVRVSGGSLTGIKIENCVLQPTGAGAGITVVGAEVTIENTYVETSGGGPTLNASADGAVGAKVKVRNSTLGNPTIDATSQVTYDGAYANAKGFAIERCTLGTPVDDTQWGPPNQENGVNPKSGAVYQRGFVWKDAYGVAWICTTAGTSQGAKFVPRDGRIIRPIPAAQWGNGGTFWWSQEDTIVRAVSLVCGAGQAMTGTDATQAGAIGSASPQDIIELVQLPYATLSGAAGASVSAAKNTQAGARLSNKQELYFTGSASNVAASAANRLITYVDHNPAAFTAGTVLVVIDTYPLRMA